MKTLILLSLGSGYGGAERSVETILQHLPDGIKVLVYAQNRLHIERLLCPGALPRNAKLIRAASTDSAWSKHWASLRLLYDCLKNPDAKIVINTQASALIAAMTAKFLPSLGKRSFIYVRDFLWTDLDYIFGRLSDAKILLPSAVVAKRLGYLSPYYLQPFGPMSHSVVPDMVALLTPPTQQPLQQAGNNVGFFLHLATVNGWKGHADLLVTASILRSSGSAIPVRSYGPVGDSALDTKLRRLIASLDLGEFYQINDHAPDPTTLLKACVGLVVTSRSHSGGPETFGRAVIEAWAQGKPVIAYNCGAVGELIDHGVDGVLIDEGDTTALADAMRTLIESPQTSQRLGQAGLEKVKRLYEAGAVTNLLIDRVFSSDGIQRKSTPTDTPASSL